MSTFGDMQSQILDDTNRDDITAQVDLAIKHAVDHYNNLKTYWFQEDRAYTEITGSNDIYGLPSDLNSELDLVSITEDSHTYVLSPKPMEWIEDRSQASYPARPAHYALYDQHIRLAPYPDRTLTLTIHYKKTLTEMTATAAFTDNWFSDAYELIRHRATKDVYLNTLHDDASGARAERQELQAEMALDLKNLRRQRQGKVKRHL